MKKWRQNKEKKVKHMVTEKNPLTFRSYNFFLDQSQKLGDVQYYSQVDQGKISFFSQIFIKSC